MMAWQPFDPGDVGKVGEEKAAAYLKRSGYRIRERNYRCRAGEIDIVAEKAEFIVFVEVKSRMAGSGNINPLISVTRAKQARIRKLGEIFLNHRSISGSQPRFDVIGITFADKTRFELEHIENAF